MTLVVLCCDKGSPGVTTAALALASVWPQQCVLAELDPAGADLPLRLRHAAGHPLAPEPGLLTLAAEARSGMAGERVWAHTQPTSAGVAMLQGALSTEQARALATLWGSIAVALRSAPGTVLADVGRLQPGNPAMPVAAAADVVVAVARASVESVYHLRDRLAVLVPSLAATARVAPAVRVLLVAEPRRGEEAVREAGRVFEHDGLPTSVLGWLAVDPAAVSMLQDGDLSARLDRSMLMRSARQVAGWLAALAEGRAKVAPLLLEPGNGHGSVTGPMSSVAELGGRAVGVPPAGWGEPR